MKVEVVNTEAESSTWGEKRLGGIAKTNGMRNVSQSWPLDLMDGLYFLIGKDSRKKAW